MKNGFFSGLKLFGRAFHNTKREMLASLEVLTVLTIFLAAIMYFAEHAFNSEYRFWDALIWTFVKYVSDPAEIGVPPQTTLGMVVGTIVGILGIAIVAVPAGLVGSGFIEAMGEKKREQELAMYRKKLLNSFSAGPGKKLREYVNKLPKTDDAWYNGCQFGYLVNNVSAAKFEIHGISLKDLIDVCNVYPEFRIKNQASAVSMEDHKTDRYMIEHFPVNRRYGFFANRGAKVTIVSTSSASEFSTGNFSYYLAKFAGFNYISKDFNAADGESYYTNHWGEPFYEGVTLQERIDNGEKISRDVKKAYANKALLRKEFLGDLESLCQGEDHWVIMLLSHVTNSTNQVDVQLADNTADGKNPTVTHNEEIYAELLDTLTRNLQQECGLSVAKTTNYPLTKRGTFRNLAYKMQEDGCRCNILTIRVSTDLMEFNTSVRVAQFIMAKTIHDIIEPEHRLAQAEIDDMNRTSRFRGFADQEIDTIKPMLLDHE